MKKPSPFGKYLLLERVNVGGMAEVFIAKSFGVEGFEKLVAIKKILPTMAEDEEFITMFIDEARISVQLSHANVVHIHELGKHEGSYYIAMEYVSGRDLRAIIERQRKAKQPMPVAQAAYVAAKICEGLDYAHRKKDARGQDLNIIHRDVSPQNILLSFDGEVKLIDFGIAKAANRSQKTQAGILKGKFGYMSPEQVMGKPIDRRSDVFAAGVLLYEMLTGERLFVGESDFSTLEKVRNAEVPPARNFNPDLPPALEKVLEKALARDVEARYQWCSDLQEDLMRFLISGDGIYGAKQLSAFMKQTFADELKREGERMERFASAARPEGFGQPVSDSLSATPAPAPKAAAPRAKLSPSVPVKPTEATPHRAPVPTQAAEPEPEPSSPTLFEEDAEAGPSEKTQIVDHSSAMKKIAEYEARLQQQKAASAPASDEIEPSNDTLPPEGPELGGAKVLIGDPAMLAGETRIGLLPEEAPVEPSQSTRLMAAVGEDEDTASGQRARPELEDEGEAEPENATRMLSEPVAPKRASPTQMLAAQDEESAEGDDEAPGTDDGEYPEDEYAEDPADGELDDTGEATTSERGARAPRAAPVAAGPSLADRLKQLPATLRDLEPNKRYAVLGGAAAVVLILLIAIASAFGSRGHRTLVVAVVPAEVAKIEINGHPVENSAQTAVEPGDYEIVATAPGYRTQTQRVHVTKDADPALVTLVLEQDLPEPKPAVAEAAAPEPKPAVAAAPESAPAPGAEARPEPAKPTTFVATFTTAQLGVEVTVDGRSAGKTPKAQLADLEVGKTYRYVAHRSGFKPAEGEFRSDGEAKITVSFELEREPAAEQVRPAVAVSRPTEPKPDTVKPAAAVRTAKGKLACSSRPVGAQIWIDNRNTGRVTPLAISNALPLPVGSHRLQFKMGSKASVPTTVEIKQNEVTKFVGDLE